MKRNSEVPLRTGNNENIRFASCYCFFSCLLKLFERLQVENFIYHAENIILDLLTAGDCQHRFCRKSFYQCSQAKKKA